MYIQFDNRTLKNNKKHIPASRVLWGEDPPLIRSGRNPSQRMRGRVRTKDSTGCEQKTLRQLSSKQVMSIFFSRALEGAGWKPLHLIDDSPRVRVFIPTLHLPTHAKNNGVRRRAVAVAVSRLGSERVPDVRYMAPELLPQHVGNGGFHRLATIAPERISGQARVPIVVHRSAVPGSRVTPARQPLLGRRRGRVNSAQFETFQFLHLR